MTYSGASNVEVIGVPGIVETTEVASRLVEARLAYRQAQKDLGALAERRRRVTMGNGPSDFMHTLLDEASPPVGRGYEFTITEDRFLEAVERAWMAGRHSAQNGRQ